MFVAVNAGRPKSPGPRYASGKLKPIAPNPIVIAHRRALVGNFDAKGLALRPAENALDLALARGWLGKELHTAAEDFATLHRRSGLTVSQLRASNPEPTVKAHNGQRSDAVALYRLTTIWAKLVKYPQAKSALIDACILNAWPPWITDLIMGGKDEMTPPRHALRLALAIVLTEMQKPVPDLSGGSDLSKVVDYIKAGKLRAA